MLPPCMHAITEVRGAQRDILPPLLLLSPLSAALQLPVRFFFALAGLYALLTQILAPWPELLCPFMV